MPPLLTWIVANGLLIAAAYLIGSVPTGYLAGKLLKGIDIREQGSGSTGATNVLRILGKGPGVIVLGIDIAKGAIAIAIVQWMYIHPWFVNQAPPNLTPALWLPWMVVLSGLAAILGHSKSIWLGFTGGKSVAASLGILLMINPLVGLATIGIFGVVLTLTRIVSLSSMSGAIALPILMVVLHQDWAYVGFAITGGIYVLWRHSSNVQRLLAGTEPRLGHNQPQPQ